MEQAESRNPRVLKTEAVGLNQRSRMREVVLTGLAQAGVVRVRVLVVSFRRLVFGSLVLVVVMLFMGVRLLRGKRRAGKHRKKQSRGKQSLHASNPNMISISGRRALVTPVPREQPGVHWREGRALLQSLNPDADGDDGGDDDGTFRQRTPDLQTSSEAVLLQAVFSCAKSYHEIDCGLNSTIGSLHLKSNHGLAAHSSAFRE